MSTLYGRPQREFQDRFETRSLADRVAAVTVHDHVTDEEREFIEGRDMLFLSTIDERGMPTVSYKGGDAGFVRVLDPTTLAFPSYDGNGMFLSTGNLCANANVGLLFLDLEQPHRVRVHGRASIDVDDPLSSEIPGAQLVVRVKVSELFVNCPRYVHRYRKLEASRFVPRATEPTPVPDWKRIDLLQDVLTDADRAAAAEAGLLSAEAYAERQKRS